MQKWFFEAAAHHLPLSVLLFAFAAINPHDGPDEANGTLCAAYSPDGRTLAVGCMDGNIRIFETKDYRFIGAYKAGRRSAFPVFSPDGRIIATDDGDGAVKFLDASTGAVRLSVPCPSSILSFSPDGKRFASSEPVFELSLRNVSDGGEPKRFRGHSALVMTAAFSPDGKILASGSMDHTIRVWDVSTGAEVAKLGGHTGYVGHLAFSPDGKSLATCSVDNSVRLWSIETRKEVARLDYKPRGGDDVGFFWVAYSPDGKLIAASCMRGVVIWDSATRLMEAELTGPNETVEPLLSIGFSPDGKFLAASSFADRFLIWDVQAKKPRWITYKD